MKTTFLCGVLLFTCLVSLAAAADDASLPKAFIDGIGPGWRALGEQDFVNVNCAPDTWSFKNGQIQCTGVPTGVMRTKDQYTNFELVVEWKHLKPAGNSGVFVWGTEESIKELAAEGSRRRLPTGIEVQILDHGYKENYLQKNKGKKAGELFFSTNGDVFPTGTTTLTPFPPTSPNGQRSFPRKELSKGSGQWNHYYVRAINGEVRLWVNGEEVSGATACNPSSGYICLESEGAPIDFKDIRIRELP